MSCSAAMDQIGSKLISSTLPPDREGGFFCDKGIYLLVEESDPIISLVFSLCQGYGIGTPISGSTPQSTPVPS